MGSQPRLATKQVTDCLLYKCSLYFSDTNLFGVLRFICACFSGLHCCGVHSARGLVLMSWRISGYSWPAMLPRGASEVMETEMMSLAKSELLKLYDFLF